MHPSGLHVLVGFHSSVKLMNLLMDDIRPSKEFAIKGCTECRFSTGGQYFAVANSATIAVVSTYTGETVASLRAHTDRVTSLAWSPDDRSLYSAGLDGCVYKWDVVAGAPTQQSTITDAAVTCLSVPPSDHGMDVFVVGSHSMCGGLASRVVRVHL